MLFSIDRYLFTYQVGLARVVDISRLAAEERRIDDVVFVKAEEVAVSDTQFLIVLFSLVGDRLSDFFTDVLYDDIFGLQSESQSAKRITYGWHAKRPLRWILLIQTSTCLGLSLAARYFIA